MKRIKIAILDTGIDKNHPDIAARWSERIKGWRSWIRPDDASEDVSGHGTHAASLLMTAAPEADLYVARIAKDSKSSMDPRDVAQVDSDISLSNANTNSCGRLFFTLAMNGKLILLQCPWDMKYGIRL